MTEEYRKSVMVSMRQDVLPLIQRVLNLKRFSFQNYFLKKCMQNSLSGGFEIRASGTCVLVAENLIIRLNLSPVVAFFQEKFRGANR